MVTRSFSRHILVGGMLVLLFVSTLVGCGSQESSGANTGHSGRSEGIPSGTVPAAPGGGSAGDGATTEEAAKAADPTAMGQLVSTAGSASSIPRRIIYTAEVTLVTDNLTVVEDQLKQLVGGDRGYISSASVTGEAGASRAGRWTLRIPVARYQECLGAIRKLGELQSLQSNTQDVTEEFVDLGAQLRSKRLEETRLQEHLQRSTARLTDILAVEKELSRVRTEVEQLEGRLRFLTHQSDLTTITVTAQQPLHFSPPERTPFLAMVRRTFVGSLEGMRDFGAALVLMLVGALPWVVVGALIGIPLWRRARRRAAGSG